MGMRETRTVLLQDATPRSLGIITGRHVPVIGHSKTAGGSFWQPPAPYSRVRGGLARRAATAGHPCVLSSPTADPAAPDHAAA